MNFLKKSFDLVVVGTSLPGLACAKEASKLGAKVCVISKWHPQKLFEEEHFLNFLHQAVKHGNELKESIDYGWTVGNENKIQINWKTFMKQLQTSKLPYIQDRLKKFLDDEVKLINFNPRINHFGQVFDADFPKGLNYHQGKYTLIAPPESQNYPNIAGAEKYGMLLNDLLTLKELGGRILVVGENIAALQLISSLVQLGYDVTLLCKRQIAKHYDRQMVELFTKSLEINRLKILLKCIISEITKNDEGRLIVKYIQLTQDWKNEAIFDYVIFTTTKCCNLKTLGLNEFYLDAKGQYIKTNEKFETKIRNVYAIGKCNPRLQDNPLTSIQIGKNLARVLFGDMRNVFNIYDVVGVIRGKLDYAFVGLTEEEAFQRHEQDEIDVFHSYMKPLEFSVPQTPITQCYLKMICLRKSPEKILGMHFHGPNAATVIQGYAAALKSGSTREEICNTVGIFPTVAREFTLLKITKRSGQNPKPSACCS